jgi:hypothetical protein
MNENPNFYNNENIPEEERRNIAFQTVNAIRESVTLAKNSTLSVTYEFAFGIIKDLNSNLYNSIIDLLISKNENEIVKYYKEEAYIRTTPEKPVEPLDLITEELERVEKLLDEKDSLKATYVKKRKFQLVAALEYFKPRKQSEHKSLNHDFYLKTRYQEFNKPLYDGDNYKDFRINENKVLRLRMLHPDHEETILGVDLIYENFDLELERVRFAHMQYKSWDGKSLYLSQAKNLMPQLEKMVTNVCKSGLCKGPDENRAFRFPYCSAFLRPTNKLQKAESKLITTGLHLPICEALKILKEKDGIIKKSECSDKSIKGKIFEELFIDNLAGSRWISIDELELFYEKKGILSHTNSIRIHAQEIDFKLDAEKNKNKS